MTSLTPPDPESHYAIKKTIIDNLTHEIKSLNDKTTTNGVTAENLKHAILAGAEKAAQEITMAGAGGPATNLRDSTIIQHVPDKGEGKAAEHKAVESLQSRIEELEGKVVKLGKYCGFYGSDCTED